MSGCPESPRPALSPVTAACFSPLRWHRRSPRILLHGQAQPRAIFIWASLSPIPDIHWPVPLPCLTAQVLTGSVINSLLPAFVPGPRIFDGLPMPLCQGSPQPCHCSRLLQPARCTPWLAQGISRPVLCPSSAPGVDIIPNVPLFQLGSSCPSTSCLLPTLPLTDKCVTSELLKGIPLATGDTSPEPELLPGGE